MNNHHYNWNKINKILAYSILVLVVGILSVYILKNVSWMYSDIAPILQSIASGKVMTFQSHITPYEGRFFPFSTLDYNLLLLFKAGNTPIGYYIIVLISFIILVTTLVFVLNKILQKNKYSGFNIWIIIIFIFFIIQRFFDPLYINIQYPERQILPLSALFILLTYKFYETDKWKFGFIALIIAVYITYSKEIVFGALIVFVLTNFIFNYKGLTRNILIFNWILVLNSIFFIILYYLISYQYVDNLYYSGSGITRIQLLRHFLLNQKFVIVALIVFLIRIYVVVVKKNKESLLLDAFLFAGISYIAACIFLRLEYYYYYSPGFILVLPAVIFYLVKYIKPIGAFTVAVIFLILYVLKIVPIVQASQQRRLTEYSIVEKIADFEKNNYQMLWYEPSLENYSTQQLVANREGRDLLRDHLAFILKNDSYQFKIVKTLPERIDDKTLILFLKIFDTAEIDKFNSITSNYQKDTVAQIGEITVLKLNKLN